MKYAEAAEQAAFFKWLYYKYPDVYALTFHIPNGGKRSAREGYKLQLQGVKRGVPDVCVAIPRKHYHGLYIEFKRPLSASKYPPKLTPEQSSWLDKLNLQGYYAVVAYGWDDAKNILEKYLQ